MELAVCSGRLTERSDVAPVGILRTVLWEEVLRMVRFCAKSLCPHEATIS